MLSHGLTSVPIRGAIRGVNWCHSQPVEPIMPIPMPAKLHVTGHERPRRAIPKPCCRRFDSCRGHPCLACPLLPGMPGRFARRGAMCGANPAGGVTARSPRATCGTRAGMSRSRRYRAARCRFASSRASTRSPTSGTTWPRSFHRAGTPCGRPRRSTNGALPSSCSVS